MPREKLPGDSLGSVRLLQEAIDGECDGLAIDRKQAACILNHVGPAIAGVERDAWMREFVQPLGAVLNCLPGHLAGDNAHMINAARKLDAAAKDRQVLETVPQALRRIADELERIDTRPGNFSKGTADSLRGRARILEQVDIAWSEP